MRNFQGNFFIYAFEYMGRFSNLHQRTFKMISLKKIVHQVKIPTLFVKSKKRKKIQGHSETRFARWRARLHMFQPSRFKRETPVLRGCLPSSRLISKSPVLRETYPNFQFFVKIPICIASYFVFQCFNCVTAIGNAKNKLQIYVNSLFLQ